MNYPKLQQISQCKEHPVLPVIRARDRPSDGYQQAQNRIAAQLMRRVLDRSLAGPNGYSMEVRQAIDLLADQ